MNSVVPVVFFSFALAAACAAGPVTAYEALISIGRQKGNPFLDSLIEMRALKGAPQPQQWTALFRDPSARGGLREFVVAAKGVSSERTPLRADDALLVAPTIPYAQLKLDSAGAFSQANQMATKAKVGFDSVSYRLGSQKGEPVWSLHLFDASRREVANLAVSAKTGSVVSPLAKAASATAASPDSTRSASDQRPLGERWAEGGGLVGHMTRWSERTWEATTNAAGNVGRSVETFFVGQPGNDPARTR